MYPILFHWPFELHTFGVLVLLGAILGLRWVKQECIRLGLDHEVIGSLAVEIFLAGLLGTRVLFVLQNWDAYSELPWYMPFNLRQGGLVWYGGPIFGMPVAIWRMHVYKVRPWQILDIFAMGLVLGHAVGRIGCFMAGDDHGKIWTPDSHWPQWFTVTFTDPNALVTDKSKYLNVPLLPSQLLMSAGKFTIFAVLVGMRRRLMSKHPGALMSLYFFLYSIERYAVEWTRGDDARKYLARDTVIGDISTSQAISLVAFPVSLALLIWCLKRKNPYAGLPPSPAAPPEQIAQYGPGEDAQALAAPAATEPAAGNPAPAAASEAPAAAPEGQQKE